MKQLTTSKALSHHFRLLVSPYPRHAFSQRPPANIKEDEELAFKIPNFNKEAKEMQKEYNNSVKASTPEQDGGRVDRMRERSQYA